MASATEHSPRLDPVGDGRGLSGYSHEHPLILLTDYPPDTPGGGAVILRSLLRPEDRERVVWMTLTPPDQIEVPGFETAVLKSGSHGKSRGRKRSVGLDQTIFARALADEALTVARVRGARAFWVVMHGAAVQIANRLLRRHVLPVHLTVHDDPAFANALRSRKYLGLVSWIDGQFAESLVRADSVDVIGEAMADRYRRLYGVYPVIVHRAMDSTIEPSPPYDPVQHGLRVGVLGSTYSYGQLPQLGRAVAKAASELGVPGRVLVVGRSHGERLKAHMGDQIEVEVIGHVDEAEGIARLRDCFALYLNYPFARRDLVLRQTSFPTKLSTYLQAARPLLLHVPDDSSVMPLLDVEYEEFARPWNSMHHSEGAARLLELWNDPKAFTSRHDAAELVRRRYYDARTNRRVLFNILNALPVGGPPR